MRIGFIGLGVMGRPMAGHLIAAGHELHVWARREVPRDGLEAATWHGSAADVAAAAEAICTIVGDPDDVADLYRNHLFDAASPGTLLIDLTTSSPGLAAELAAEAAGRGLTMLDAPVSGGDRGARAGELSVMVGGSDEAFARGRPVLDAFAKAVVHQGGPGAGQHCKMCNQIAVAAGMLSVAESVAYAKAAGLDPETVLASITGGAAGSWSLSHLAPRMLAGDDAPGFMVRHFLKDMRIALDSARRLGLELPGLELAERTYERLAAAGHGDSGTQAVVRLYVGG